MNTIFQGRIRLYTRLILSFLISLLVVSHGVAFAETKDESSTSSWPIYYRPGVRCGTDNRTLYINDFLIPLYQDEKNILFSNTQSQPALTRPLSHVDSHVVSISEVG